MTERPESLGTVARLVTPDDDLLDVTSAVFRERAVIARQLEGLPSPYGDDSAAQRCVVALDRLLSERMS